MAAPSEEFAAAMTLFRVTAWSAQSAIGRSRMAAEMENAVNVHDTTISALRQIRVLEERLCPGKKLDNLPETYGIWLVRQRRRIRQQRARTP